jgi:hypothetical protein
LYRLFVAGRMQGPGMFDVSALLGKEEVAAVCVPDLKCARHGPDRSERHPLFAYHGCLKEEGSIGGHYRVDVAVEGDLDRAETKRDRWPTPSTMAG